MRKEAERAALRALRDAHADASFSVTREELEKFRTLDDALAAFGWRVVRGGDELSIRGVRYVGEDYQGNEEGLFEALAPYVEPGSVIDIQVGGETPKRFKFTGRTLIEKRVKPPDVFVPYEGDDDEPPPSRIPVFSDVYKDVPPTRRAYVPSQTFSPGEWIDHPKFGAGLVLKGAEPGKVRVLFESGERTLLQGR